MPEYPVKHEFGSCAGILAALFSNYQFLEQRPPFDVDWVGRLIVQLISLIGIAMNGPTDTPAPEIAPGSAPETDPESAAPARNDPHATGLIERMPQLSSRGLTLLLIIGFIFPALIILGLFYILPPVQEQQLPAAVGWSNVPPPSFYRTDPSGRPKIENAELWVTNQSDKQWTNFYIRINRHYSIFDQRVFPAGETRSYQLNRFVARMGATYDISIVPLRNVEIYARMPSGARFTYDRPVESIASESQE